MDDMSDEQSRGLEDFKAYIKESGITDHPQFDDYYLLRFLRARKFDQEKSRLMFNNFLDWRKENEVDTILEVKSPALNSFRPSTSRSIMRFNCTTLTRITRRT